MKALIFESSPVIAGCMRWGQWGARMEIESMQSMIEGCLSMGIDTFDHADIYGGSHSTESTFGRVLLKHSSLRDRMRIITKCGILLPDGAPGSPSIKHYNTSETYVIASAESSLRALQTDHIDLLLIHRPDPLMHLEEMAGAFYKLHKLGKVLHFGVSNFNGTQLRLMHKYWPIAVNQLQLSVAHPQVIFDGTIDTCMELDIRAQAWSPMGAGLIKIDSDDERHRKLHAVAQIIAQHHGCDVSQVLMSWVLNHPAGIVPVVGTTKLDRLRLALGSVDIRINREEWFMLLRASLGRDLA